MTAHFRPPYTFGRAVGVLDPVDTRVSETTKERLYRLGLQAIGSVAGAHPKVIQAQKEYDKGVQRKLARQQQNAESKALRMKEDDS